MKPSAFWLAFWLAAVMAGAKVAHWGVPEPTRIGLRDWVRDVLVSAHADVAFAAGLGVATWVVLFATRRSPRAHAIAWRTFLGLGVVSAVYAVASVQIFAFLRSPLTYPLLYLAGDMKNMSSSIGSFVTAPVAAALLLVPFAYVAAVRVSSRLGPARGGPVLRAAGLLGLLAYLYVAHQAALGRWHDRSDHLIARNPHWELLASLVDVARGAGPPPIDEDFPPELLEEFAPARAPVPLPGAVPPRNVLMVVLESTAARYTSLHGSAYATTPNLEAEAAHAVVFEGFYCHVGLTANAVAALSLSVYPYMTWREYTVEYPELPGETLAERLKPLGYRTAFLHNGHLEYTDQDRFLAGRGYDDVHDWRHLGRGEPLTSWGGEDRVLVDHVLDWIDRGRERPFFAVAWTIQSHHPYEPSPGSPFVDFFGGHRPRDDYDLGRYLNTIHEADRQLGRLFEGLRTRGLAEDTLVVVTGDHGQAFGDPHATWGHGSRVYDENVRVPLMVWSPRLFPEGRRDTAIVGGHVDLNPTVAHLLGQPPSPTWHGRSLFDPRRPRRTYFYAANDDYLLGVREGKWKYIYNATRGREELYDLTADPDERTSVAPRHPDLSRRLRQRLAAWRAHVGQELQGRLAQRERRDPLGS